MSGLLATAGTAATAIAAALAATALAATALTATARADTRRVPDEFPTIAAGLDGAASGDTVLIACGVYHEHGLAIPAGVTLRSAAGAADCVTIDAAAAGRVIRCSGDDPATRLEGLTITGGHAADGAGLACESGASPAIDRCAFIDNVADDAGGGLHCWSAASPTLTACLFAGNTAGSGAGLAAMEHSSPTLDGCTFAGNIAGVNGGALYCRTGSMAVLTACTLSGNRAGLDGSNLYAIFSSPMILERCLIAFGGDASEAVYCDLASTPALVCCDVYGNSGGDWIGCIEEQGGVAGNISLDPLFCSTRPDDDRNWLLQAASPCAAAACGLIGAWPVGCVASVETGTWGRLKALLRHGRR